MRIVITGAEGLVGGVLRKGLSPVFDVHALTRTAQSFPSSVADLCDLAALTHAFSGATAVVHLAAAANLDASWEEVKASNIEGMRNVYEAARIGGVKRVVMASSGHVIGLAEERAGPNLYALDDRRVFDEHTPPAPDSLYAVSKIYGEVLGRFYSDSFGLSVICLRLGTVLPDDNPKSEQAGRGRSAAMSAAERYPRMRAKWLSHRDCCQIFARALTAESVPYLVAYATSNNPRQIWSLESARRTLGFAPEDAAPVSNTL